jgi:hypothetical protein
MLKHYRYIIIAFLAILFSVNLTLDNNCAKASSNADQLSYNTFYNTPLYNASTDGKLPIPAHPIKKKQTAKRLVCKRVAVSATNFTFNSCADYNCTFCTEQYIAANSYQISFYKQALMAYCSLHYLY